VGLSHIQVFRSVYKDPASGTSLFSENLGTKTKGRRVRVKDELDLAEYPTFKT